MKRVIAAMVAALLMVALASSAAFAASGGKGNSDPAKLCKSGGYVNYVGTSGAFATQSACVSYAVNGGKLYPKTATLTSSTSGPVAGLGALVGNPQSRVAGGIADPAMLFTLGGSSWVPNVAISLTYTAGAPLNYSYTNPSGYFPTAPAATASGTGTLSTWFQDNCFDGSNHLVSGNVSYTITGTNVDGQSASVAGILNCNAIAATDLATANTPKAGCWDGGTCIDITSTGWHWPASTSVALTYSVAGTDDGQNLGLGSVTTDANGSYAFEFNGDNCVYGVGGNPATLQTTDFTFTMTAFDGTHTATATGVLKCSLLQ